LPGVTRLEVPEIPEENIRKCLGEISFGFGGLFIVYAKNYSIKRNYGKLKIYFGSHMVMSLEGRSRAKNLPKIFSLCCA
jgi:hypothetical protein